MTDLSDCPARLMAALLLWWHSSSSLPQVSLRSSAAFPRQARSRSLPHSLSIRPPAHQRKTLCDSDSNTESTKNPLKSPGPGLDALPDVDALLDVDVGSLVEPEVWIGQCDTSSRCLYFPRLRRFQEKWLYFVLVFFRGKNSVKVPAEVTWPNTVASSLWAFCLFFLLGEPKTFWVVK